MKWIFRVYDIVVDSLVKWILECSSDIDIHTERHTTISMEAYSNTLFTSCHINQNSVTVQHVHASDTTDYPD